MSGATSDIQVGKEDIVAGLRELGVEPGDGIIVHSSLKRFGFVKGGPRAVAEGIMEVLTSDGTLVMPSFNHEAPFLDGGLGVYDPTITPTTNGSIPDQFWRMPDVYRSLNPTHPFAAWGKHSRRYIEFHHRTLTMGPDSPLGLLLADGGSCLLLGVDYSVNTFHHVVETSTGAPCLGLRTEVYPMLLPDGRKVEGRTWGWREKACPLTDKGEYGAQMRSRNLHIETMIGKCQAILFRLEDCYEVVVEILSHGKGDFPPCHECQNVTRCVPRTVPSDWDREKQCLLPDSVAWTF